MANIILFHLLGSLSAQEYKSFGDFVRSPYFNKNESVIKLYDYLKGFHPGFSHKDLEKKNIHGKLFPHVNYDDAFMRKVMFNLSKLAEVFLAHSHFAKESFTFDSALLDEFNRRDLPGMCLKKLATMEDDLNKRKIRDVDYYEMRNKLNSFRSFMVMRNAVFVNTKDKPGEIFAKETSSLVDYFLMRVLKDYKFLFNFKKMLSYEFDSSAFYKEVISYLKENESHHNIPLLSLHFYTFLLILEKKEMYFEKAKSILMIELDSLSYDDKYTTCAVLVNFANDEYHKGKVKYLRERHKLHKFVIEQKLTSGSGEGLAFNEILFKNIVTVALQLGEIEWTENFITSNIDLIEKSIRDNMLNLSNAFLNFEKKNYEKALEELSRISSVKHFHYKASIKILTLMIYFEKGWHVQASDVIDTFRHYLQNNKIMPEFQKERHINFLRFYNELLRLSQSQNISKLTDLNIDLKSTENVQDKEWLVRMVEDQLRRR